MTKFENTIKEMQEEIDDLKDTLKAKADTLDETSLIKARELVDKTVDVINTTIGKVKGVAKEEVDEDKVDDFLENVETKVQEAVDYAKAKIEEFSKSEYSLDNLFDEISADFEKIKSSDTFKKVSDLAKDAYNQVNDYLSKPEVKQAITKAKETTINIAEKGVEGLKKVLSSKPVKTTKKAAKAKKTTKKTAKKKAAK